MKNKLVAALALVLALPGSSALAQTTTTPAQTPAWQTTFFESPSVAIPLLTAAAIRYSAQVKLLDVDKLAAKQDLQITKKSILNGIGAGATYSYGNQAGVGLPTTDPNQPPNQQPQFNTYSASRYSTGLNASFSIGQLLSRHNLINRDKLNLQRTELTRQDREDQMKQTVIQLYQNVVLAKKLLTLQQESYVTTQSTYRLTEKQFRAGQIALPDFTAATAQLNGSAVGLETTRNQYETSFMLLEALIGTKISTIMSAP